MQRKPPSSRTILVVDATPSIRAIINKTLHKEGHRVIEAVDGPTALSLARQHRPDLVILDQALPGMNGFEFCAHLRTMPHAHHTLILFLGTEKNASVIAQALDAGGDDYLRKPFAARELRARVQALLRRLPQAENHRSLAALQLDPEQHRVIVGDRQVELTPTEFQLLEFLCKHPNDYHAAPKLLEAIWQYPPGTGDTALVRNHVRNLRRKIESNPDLPEILVSLHGRGYTVRAQME